MLYPCIIIVAFCRGNCSRFRPENVGGCQTCRAGFTGAPECCECEPGKTYIDGVCSKCHISVQEKPFDPIIPCVITSMPIVLRSSNNIYQAFMELIMGLTRYFMKNRYYSLTNLITVFVTSRI